MPEKCAQAMKEFIERPLPNSTIPPTTIDLQCISAGSLGDIRLLIVRAVLTALRDIDPDDAAWKAGDAISDCTTDTWQAMIDAILAEKP